MKSIKILLIDLMFVVIVPTLLSYLIFKIALPKDQSSLSDVINVNFGLLPDFLVFLATGVPSLLGIMSQSILFDAVITLAVDGVIIFTLYRIARIRLGTTVFDSMTIAVSMTICLAETIFMLIFVDIMILSQGL